MAGDTVELIRRFRTGDERAYRELFERYRLELAQFVRSHMDAGLRATISPEDVLQETHLEALRSLERFTYRRELSFYFWLCGIARNRIHHHCRLLARRPPPVSLSPRTAETPSSSQEIIEKIEAGGRNPADEAVLRQNLDLLATAMESLPGAQREAVLLRYIEGHDNQEAAAMSGIEPGAFRVRLMRGLMRLREVMAEMLGEPPPGAPP